MIYIVGSLTNPRIPEIAKQLDDAGHKTFCEWHAAGEFADRYWQEHFEKKGYDMRDALKMAFPQTALKFDRDHINSADCGVLVMPAGRSGHLELGRMNGQGKPTFVLFEDGPPAKWDLMYGLLTGIAYSVEDLIEQLDATIFRRA